VDFQDARLEDVMRFLEDVTGADLEPLWLDDRHASGLDPEATVSLEVSNVPVIALLERVLARTDDDFDRATWQFGEFGEVQVGPRSRLNRYDEMKIYDINDLLFVIQDFDEAPDLGLGEIIEGGGGGGTQSDFEVEEPEGPTRDERAMAIVEILVSNIEPDQWVDNGGDAASVRFYQGHLIVRAPDYIHRKIMGYPFWPRASFPAGGGGNGGRGPSADAGGSAPEERTVTRYSPDGSPPEQRGGK